tara:strand:+ start:2714 stop:3568 length:855 start_codon:yes stop_codon:yes gene_type:complete
MENLNEGKKSNYMTELAEIDKQSALVALEAKINKLAEMAEAKTNRLNLVNEDENLSELISKQAVKEMQRSIKEIERLKEKLLKEFTKKGGKMTEVIDEEMDDNTSDEINPANTRKQKEDREKYLKKGAMPPHMVKKEEVEEEMKDEKVEEEMENKEMNEGGYMSNYEEDDKTMEEEMKDPNTGVVSDDSIIHNYLDEDAKKYFGVFRIGGSMGQSNEKLVYSFAKKEDAIKRAKELRSGLTPGEKSHYGMRYVTRPTNVKPEPTDEKPESVNEEIKRFKKLAGL